MELQEALENLDREISELTPQEAIAVLEDLHKALPMLIFIMKVAQLNIEAEPHRR